MPHGPHSGPGKVSVKCGSRNYLASLPALKPRVLKDALCSRFRSDLLSEQRRNFYAEEIVGALVILITGKYLVNVYVKRN